MRAFCFFIVKSFKLFSIGYKMVFLSHILPFYYSVALLCSAKKPKSRTKTPIFRFNQKSLNHFIVAIQPSGLMLHFLAHTGHRNIQLFAVFGNGSAGNGVATLFENFGKLVVWQGFVFVFFFDNVF
jgi:hypothetical protein